MIASEARERREAEHGRLGPQAVLDLLAKHTSLDILVRAPLSLWATGARFIKDTDHPRVLAIRAEGGMRRSRVGPPQRPGEVTLTGLTTLRVEGMSSVHVAVGNALVSTLRMLDEHGLARIERNDRGQIARVRRARRGRA